MYIAKNSLNPAKMSKNNAINFKNIPKKPKAFNLAVLQGMGEKPDFTIILPFSIFVGQPRTGLPRPSPFCETSRIIVEFLQNHQQIRTVFVYTVY
jgi:hypothetical protein